MLKAAGMLRERQVLSSLKYASAWNGMALVVDLISGTTESESFVTDQIELELCKCVRLQACNLEQGNET
jgi:hypothetical protein